MRRFLCPQLRETRPGKTIGIDATTLEANAALRSIVRRDSEQGYEEFLRELAVASGIQTPTREDLARLDRKRTGKGSNQQWKHPHDGDVRIARMKDGRTHLAHKAEHAVDLETGAIVSVTVQGADRGDTQTMVQTLIQAAEQVEEALGEGSGIEEVVADKGYHSSERMVDLEALGLRSYVSEPKRGKRRWRGDTQARDAVYGNRRQIRGRRGRRLLRQRGELLERPCAHLYETGGMRRVHVRGLPQSRMGERVWYFGAQSYRPFGTAAEYVVVQSAQAVKLSADVSFEQGACLGIPGMTAHVAVHVAGPVEGRIVLVQGGAGAVGSCAVALARHAGAHVIATVRSGEDELTAVRAGAHEVVCTDRLSADKVAKHISPLAPEGVHHVVEVAFHANIETDVELLAQGGSIATYATGNSSPSIPFWPLVFKNVRIFFLGSDDFSSEAKSLAARGLNDALDREWQGFEIGERFPLRSIVQAHESVETRRED